MVIADARPLPLLCNMPWTASECWGAIADYEIVAEGNTDIAKANTEALRQTNAAIDDLIRAGKMQQEYAELREEMLADEKRQHTYDKWFYRGVLALIGVGVAVSQ